MSKSPDEVRDELAEAVKKVLDQDQRNFGLRQEVRTPICVQRLETAYTAYRAAFPPPVKTTSLNLLEIGHAFVLHGYGNGSIGYKFGHSSGPVGGTYTHDRVIWSDGAPRHVGDIPIIDKGPARATSRGELWDIEYTPPS